MGQSNRKANMIVLDSVQSNDSEDIVFNDTAAYAAPYSVSGTQLVYADWVLAQIAVSSKVSLTFNKASTNPIVINNWQATYAATYGNVPTILAYTVLDTAISTLNTLVAGTGGTNGTYYVNLTGGTGANASASIVISGGIVSSVQLIKTGNGYTVGDTLTGAFGGISGFSIKVATLSNTLIPYNSVTQVQDVSGLLQYVYIDDPDANPLLTADKIIVVIKP